MKIKLTGDYRGILTDEQYYTAGIYSVPDGMSQKHANALLHAGRAAEVVEKQKPVRRRTRKKAT